MTPLMAEQRRQRNGIKAPMAGNSSRSSGRGSTLYGFMRPDVGPRAVNYQRECDARNKGAGKWPLAFALSSARKSKRPALATAVYAA
jgi:hypothetical protein